MGLFDHFPYTNVHELNLDWILSMMKALEAEWEAFTAGNSLTFSDPMLHDISKSYAKNTIILDSNGNAYVSLQAVPVGVGLQNGDYWLMVFDYEAFIEKVNKNFTANYYRGSYRATAAMAIGDWLTVDDVLYKATAAIAVDDILEDGVNITHFTLEDFIKAFMQSANQLIQQYKNDIDASELAYRNQLAYDMASITDNLQAQLDAAISGATVDSEVINARVGANGTTYPTLGDAIRTQVSDIYDAVYRTIIVKNLADISSAVFSQRYANMGGQIDEISADPKYGTIDKIRLIAGHKYYSIFGATGSFVHLAKPDGTYIGLVATIHGTDITRGSYTVKTLEPTQDCDLCITVNSDNPNYGLLMVTEGIMPFGHYDFDEPIVTLYDGTPINEFIDTVDVTDMLLGSINNAINYVSGLREDWHTIRLVLDSVTYTTTSEITLPDHIIIEGSGSDKTLVRYVPVSPSDQDVEDYSLFILTKNAIFRNLKMQGVDCRYVVHCESANTYKDWKVEIENCILEHLANTTGTWNSQHCWGEGASSGSYLHAVNTTFITRVTSGQQAAFSVHNNTSFDKPMIHVFDDCQFISGAGVAFRCEGLTSGTDDKCIINNSFFSGDIYSTNSQSIEIIVSGCNLVPTHASTYFVRNSDAHYVEHEREMINNTGSTISAGTIVAYDSFNEIKVANDGDEIAGFIDVNVLNGNTVKVIQKGFYRLADGALFGQKYKVSSGSLVLNNSGTVGTSNGKGFVLIKDSYLD